MKRTILVFIAVLAIATFATATPVPVTQNSEVPTVMAMKQVAPLDSVFVPDTANATLPVSYTSSNFNAYSANDFGARNNDGHDVLAIKQGRQMLLC